MVSHDALQQESPHLCQLPTRAGGVTALKTTQERQSVHLARIGGRLGQRLQTLEKLHARTGGGKKMPLQRCPAPLRGPFPGVGHGRLIHPGDDGKLRLTHLGFGKLQFAGLVGCCLQQVDKGRCQAFIALPWVGKAGFGSRKNRRKTVGKAQGFHERTTTKSRTKSSTAWGRKKAAWRSFCKASHSSLRLSKRKYKAPATRGSPCAGTCR